MSPDTIASTWLALAKAAFYLAALVLIGAASSLTLVLPRWASHQPGAPAVRAATAHVMVRVGVAAGVFGIASTLARWHAQTYATFGVDDTLTLEHALIIARDTTWGRGWMLQAGAMVAATLVMAVRHTRPAAIPRVVAAVPMVVAAVVPMTGHAVADAWRALVLPLQIGHVFGAGLWLGGLCGLLAAMTATVDGRDRAAPLASLIESFSPFALLGAALVVGSGAVTSVLYVGTPSALWTTSYGMTLGLKLVAFAAVAALGAFNWRRLKPAIAREPSAAGRLQRTAIAEVALASVVLLITSVLTGLPRPGEGE